MKGICVRFFSGISLLTLIRCLSASKCLNATGEDDCLEGSDGKCYILWQKKNGKTIITEKGCHYGKSSKYCTSDNQCNIRSSLVSANNVYCCCYGNMCNKELVISTELELKWGNYTQGGARFQRSREYWWVVVVCLLCLAVCFIGGLKIFVWPQRLHKTQKMSLSQEDNDVREFSVSVSEFEIPPDYETLKGLLQFRKEIGRGYYGTVFSATLKTEKQITEVAVKILSPVHGSIWLNEKSFYTCPKVVRAAHENILKFLGAQDLSGKETQLRIVTEFHEKGSLYNYLKKTSVSWKEVLKISLGLCKGAEFLHTGTPVIVHRDIKSENILIKSDLTACLSDFGLNFSFTKNTDMTQCNQVGTWRYMSPEILDCVINFVSCEGSLPVDDAQMYVDPNAIVATDIYALALVFWELFSQCHTAGGPVDRYTLPYEFELGLHPSLGIIQHTVVNKRARPAIQHHWLNDSVYSEYCSTIMECWDHDPESRLQASTIVERLGAFS